MIRATAPDNMPRRTSRHRGNMLICHACQRALIKPQLTGLDADAVDDILARLLVLRVKMRPV